MSTEGGTRAVIAALSANIAIAVSKFVAWGLTGASSMLAEAIHSVADSGNQVLLLIGGRAATRPATPSHPFGYGRRRYLAAFVVSIVLFSLGGVFALYEAWHKLEETLAGHPNQLLESRWWWVPIVVLLVAIVAEGFSFRTALHETHRARGSLRLTQFIHRAKSPELPVILLEDAGALLGLVFALVGVTLTKITGIGYFDAAGTAMIGLLLVAIAVFLAVEMSSLLLGESATDENIHRLEQAVRTTSGVERLIHMKTVHLGPDELLVAAKVSMRPGQSVEDVAATINRAEEAMRREVPIARHIFIEPDIYDFNFNDPKLEITGR